MTQSLIRGGVGWQARLSLRRPVFQQRGCARRRDPAANVPTRFPYFVATRSEYLAPTQSEYLARRGGEFRVGARAGRNSPKRASARGLPRGGPHVPTRNG